MKLRRYAVTIMDNWTPMRTFWTLEGARGFYKEHRGCANVFKWDRGEWFWMFGARDNIIPIVTSGMSENGIG